MTALILFIKKWIFYALGFMVLLMLVFIKGCNHGKTLVKCPVIVTGITAKVDTVTHYIYNIWPWYISGEDSIVYKHDTIQAKVDTLAILRDYYALHFSKKQWRDSLLEVNLDMMITENKFYPQEFGYKILRPQTIINNSVDNSTNYSKYLYIGGSVPVKDVKYTNFSLFYAFPAGLVGAGYNPYLKSIQVTGAIKLIKFKK